MDASKRLRHTLRNDKPVRFFDRELRDSTSRPGTLSIASLTSEKQAQRDAHLRRQRRVEAAAIDGSVHATAPKNAKAFGSQAQNVTRDLLVTHATELACKTRNVTTKTDNSCPPRRRPSVVLEHRLSLSAVLVVLLLGRKQPISLQVQQDDPDAVTTEPDGPVEQSANQSCAGQAMLLIRQVAGLGWTRKCAQMILSNNATSLRRARLKYVGYAHDTAAAEALERAMATRLRTCALRLRLRSA